MTASQIIDEIKSLTPEEQAGVGDSSISSMPSAVVSANILDERA